MTIKEAKRIIRRRIKKCEYDRFYYDDEYSRDAGPAYKEALSILNQINTEPVEKDKITLTELANEFRRLLEFKYMTASGYDGDQDCFKIKIWTGREKPNYERFKGWTNSSPISNYCEIDYYHFKPEIDFSEYRNEAGYIDYSKCIVEVD